MSFALGALAVVALLGGALLLFFVALFLAYLVGMFHMSWHYQKANAKAEILGRSIARRVAKNRAQEGAD